MDAWESEEKRASREIKARVKEEKAKREPGVMSSSQRTNSVQFNMTALAASYSFESKTLLQTSRTTDNV